MHCDMFNKLSEEEQNIFISKLNHAVKSNEILFLAAKRLIRTAEESGVFDDVKIGKEEVYADPRFSTQQ